MNCEVEYNLALVVLNDNNANLKVLIGIEGLKSQKVKSQAPRLLSFILFSKMFDSKSSSSATQHSIFLHALHTTLNRSLHIQNKNQQTKLNQMKWNIFDITI